MKSNKILEIPAGSGVDATTIIFRNHGDRRGSVTLICYGQPWHAFFGAMPSETIETFFLNSPLGYMESKLMPNQFRLLKAEEQRMESYLSRVVERVKACLMVNNFNQEGIESKAEKDAHRDELYEALILAHARLENLVGAGHNPRDSGLDSSELLRKIEYTIAKAEGRA